MGQSPALSEIGFDFITDPRPRLHCAVLIWRSTDSLIRRNSMGTSTLPSVRRGSAIQRCLIPVLYSSARMRAICAVEYFDNSRYSDE
jgi:hypothetical protein